MAVATAQQLAEKRVAQEQKEVERLSERQRKFAQRTLTQTVRQHQMNAQVDKDRTLSRQKKDAEVQALLKVYRERDTQVIQRMRRAPVALMPDAEAGNTVEEKHSRLQRHHPGDTRGGKRKSTYARQEHMWLRKQQLKAEAETRAEMLRDRQRKQDAQNAQRNRAIYEQRELHWQMNGLAEEKTRDRVRAAQQQYDDHVQKRRLEQEKRELAAMQQRRLFQLYRERALEQAAQRQLAKEQAVAAERKRQEDRIEEQRRSFEGKITSAELRVSRQLAIRRMTIEDTVAMKQERERRRLALNERQSEQARHATQRRIDEKWRQCEKRSGTLEQQRLQFFEERRVGEALLEEERKVHLARLENAAEFAQQQVTRKTQEDQERLQQIKQQYQLAAAERRRLQAEASAQQERVQLAVSEVKNDANLDSRPPSETVASMERLVSGTGLAFTAWEQPPDLARAKTSTGFYGSSSAATAAAQRRGRASHHRRHSDFLFTHNHLKGRSGNSFRGTSSGGPSVMLFQISQQQNNRRMVDRMGR